MGPFFCATRSVPGNIKPTSDQYVYSLFLIEHVSLEQLFMFSMLLFMSHLILSDVILKLGYRRMLFST